MRTSEYKGKLQIHTKIGRKKLTVTATQRQTVLLQKSVRFTGETSSGH